MAAWWKLEIAAGTAGKGTMCPHSDFPPQKMSKVIKNKISPSSTPLHPTSRKKSSFIILRYYANELTSTAAEGAKIESPVFRLFSGFTRRNFLTN